MTDVAHPLVTRRIRKARIATFLGFMMIGAMMYIWSTSVSVFRQQMGLAGDQGDADFGLIAMSIGVGSALGALLIGKLLDRYGTRLIIRVCAVVYPLSIIPLGLASNFWLALSFGAVLGVFRGALDTALNAHGVEVERFYQRSIMSAFHASYSFGGFMLGMVCSWLTGVFSNSVEVPYIALGSTMAAVGCLLSRWLLNQNELPSPAAHFPSSVSATSSPPLAPRFKTVLVMVAIGTLLLGSMMSENAVGDWGQEYMRRVLDASTSLGAMAVSVFVGFVTFGRLFGDTLAARFGKSRIVACCGFFCVVGILVTLNAHNAITGIMGLALFGLGLSCIAPLMVSAVGRKDPENAGRNIGIVNGIGFSGMLMGPAVITLMVKHFGLSSVMYLPLVMLSLLGFFGPMLMRTSSTEVPEVRALANPAGQPGHET